MTKALFKHLDTIILCGGLGTRLRPIVGDEPKALALVNNQPFLNILLSYLKGQGVEGAILGIGYGGDAIKSRYAANEIMSLTFSEEAVPLGTGGAFKKALSLVKNDQVMVLNGDTLCRIDYADFLNVHLTKNALLTMVVAPKERDDVGGIKLGRDHSILEFEERPTGSDHSVMNAGVYLFRKEVAALMPQEDIFSLERDFLPGLVKKQRCFGYITKTAAIDIGTPARYREAQNLI